MKPSRLFSLAAAGLLALAMSSTAWAAEQLGQVRLEWHADDPGKDFEFVVARDPDPDFYEDSSFFRLDNVTDLVSVETVGSLFILHGEMGGGFVVQPGEFAEAWAGGPQLYTGTLSEPVFKIGTFRLDAGDTGYWGGTLTISQVTDGPADGGPTSQDPTVIVTAPPAVPEPSTWLLFLCGFFAIGALLRHRPANRRSLARCAALAAAGPLALALSPSASAATLLDDKPEKPTPVTGGGLSGENLEGILDKLRFDWDADGDGRDIRFILDREPDPAIVINSYFFRMDDVVDLLTNETVDYVFFVHNRQGGGFVVQSGPRAIIWTRGDTLFTGSLGKPKFKTGTFQLQGSEAEHFGGTLTITPVFGPIPEPSTWLLLLFGFAAIGGILRRRPASGENYSSSSMSQ